MIAKDVKVAALSKSVLTLRAWRRNEEAELLHQESRTGPRKANSTAAGPVSALLSLSRNRRSTV